jgi:cell division cycle 14
LGVTLVIRLNKD